MTKKETTAIHEAGHSAMCRMVGLPLIKVTIEKLGHMAGRTHHEDYLTEADSRDMDEIYAPPELRIKAENNIMVALAGGIAEEILLGENSGGDKVDKEDVKNWAELFCEKGKEVDLYLGWITFRAHRLLGRDLYRYRIQCLSKALLKEKTIESIRVKEIFDAATQVFNKGKLKEAAEKRAARRAGRR